MLHSVCGQRDVLFGEHTMVLSAWCLMAKSLLSESSGINTDGVSELLQSCWPDYQTCLCAAARGAKQQPRCSGWRPCMPSSKQCCAARLRKLKLLASAFMYATPSSWRQHVVLCPISSLLINHSGAYCACNVITETCRIYCVDSTFDCT